MIDSQLTEDYEALKNTGNEHFKLKAYDKAISYYTRAIAVKDNEATAYSNRALCYIHLKKYFEAKEDCDKAITLDPTFIKAYYRRATVMKELLRFDKAIEDLKKIVSLDSNFALAKKELKDIEDLIKEDKRITLDPMIKPEVFRSKNAVKTFNLNNHYSGSKLYVQ